MYVLPVLNTGTIIWLLYVCTYIYLSDTVSGGLEFVYFLHLYTYLHTYIHKYIYIYIYIHSVHTNPQYKHSIYYSDMSV
jgi:hypothetical protein